MLGAVFLGLTVSQWIVLLPQIWAAIKTAQQIYEAVEGPNGIARNEAAQQALSLLGKALAKLAYDALKMTVPLPHRMTPDEEKLWMDHATPPELFDR